MIDSDLIEDHEAIAGPVEFTLSRIAPENAEKVAQMMRDTIDGKRGPITDKELGIDAPSRAEI